MTGAAVLTGPAAAAPVTVARPRPALLGRAGLMPWVPVWMAMGIGLWLGWPGQPGLAVWFVLWLAAVVLALGLGFAIRQGGRGIGWRGVEVLRLSLLAVLMIAIGFSLAGLRSARVAAPILGFRYYGPVEGRLIEVDRSGRDRLRVTLDRVGLDNLPPARTPERVRLSLLWPEGADWPIPAAGTQVMLTGHLGPPPGPAEPGGFDFRRFAWFEGLGAIGYTRTPLMIIAPAPQGGAQAIARLRLQLSQAIQQAIPGQAGAVAAAVTTGDRSGITTATDAIMRDSNLYHIVSISGLHMSMLGGFLYAVLRMMVVSVQAAGMVLRAPAHKLAAAGALIGAAAYLALSGGGAATERAFVMVAVMLGAILVDRRAISLRTVALAAVVLLAYAPEALANAGFQMSFAATVALIVANDLVRGRGAGLPRWPKWVLMLALTSIVAGAATGPIAAAQFNRISHYGLLANMAVVPVIGVLVMPGAVIAALLAPLGLAGPALWVMGLGVEWMLLVSRWVADLSGAVSPAPAPPAAVLPLLGLGGVLLALTPWERLADATGRMRLARLPRRGWLAILCLSAALGLWLTVPRPALLIAPEGEAVGLMTAAGRVPSKPSGGAFVVGRWLLADGDMATQADAAARMGWSGPRNAREIALPWGGRLLHLTGKGAEDRARQACRAGVVLVLDRAAPEGLGACRVIDLSSLRATGALAFDAQGRVTATDARQIGRPWVLPVAPGRRD